MKIKYCNNCGKQTRNGKYHYCSDVCRTIYMRKIKLNKSVQIHSIKPDGEENKDFIKCKWCGMYVKRIYGVHMKAFHPDKTTKIYKEEFGKDSLIACLVDKHNTTKNSGLHMKQEKYREIARQQWLGKNNCNHKSKTTKLQRQEKSPFSKNFKKYNSEADLKKFQENAFKDLLVPSMLKYWTDKKGLPLDEAKASLKKRQTTFTLEKCIAKLGKEAGTKRYKDRQVKWAKKLHEHFLKMGDSRTPSSKFANSCILSICNSLNLKIPKKEKFISNGTNAFAYDFTLNKKIIEFNGDYWHMNPIKYKLDYFHKKIKMTAQEKWDYDKKKIRLAEKYGYEVLIIWEADYNSQPVETIDKCLKYLQQDV